MPKAEFIGPGTARRVDDDAFAQVRRDLALRILEECRTALMMSFRYLDAALWKMPFVPARGALAQAASPLAASARIATEPLSPALATDGFRIYFDAAQVIARFKDAPDEMARDYLQAVLHCIFRQPFETRRARPQLWSYACDICVESVALELCEQRFASELDPARNEVLKLVKRAVSALTPAQLYKLLDQVWDDEGSTRDQQELHRVLRESRHLFARDGHERWKLLPLDDADEESPENEETPHRREDDSPEEKPSNEPDDKPDDPSPDDADDAADDDARGGSDCEDCPRGSQKSSAGDEALPESGANAPSQTVGDSAGPSGGAGAGSGATESQGASPGIGGENAEVGDDPVAMQEDFFGEPDFDADDENPRDKVRANPDDDDAWLDEDLEGRVGARLDETDENALLQQRDWEDISKQIEADLETLSHARGNAAGTLMANLTLANRSRINYADFLRQFARMAEDMCLNDDEFDYVYYMYGLERYGNMPLIEPLEYKESKRVREFVIAIDTSASCAGDLVRTFVTRTFEILKESEEFGSEVNVHIIQCDAAIQQDTVVTSVDEFTRYLEEFTVLGLGGTDFRPVFAYVDNLVQQKAFTDLRGLVYFTDGMGIYPDAPPNYDVAFVFVDDAGAKRRVPPWAMRVVMDEDAIRTL